MRRVGPLLETKLFVPRRRHGVVPRSRLSEQLDRGAQSKLTLISAPAGFGKTTLLADWLAAPADQRSATWLSLDAGDNDPASFWTYVIAALQTAAPGVGEGSRMLLGSDQAPIEGVLTALLNELSTVPRDVVLVLDDYHAIEASKIHAGMAFLLEHLPPQIHVLITTRADPALPLARLRAQGELVEIRAGDLRFTPDEVATYLNQAMGLGLAAQDIATLEGRTEGWIAALQLAALSMQGRDDIAGFVGGFAGDDRYIVDYLVEEVLLRQPEQLRRFLLKTSILTRMSGALCDAVTGEGGGRATLESLDRGNMFVVPLDDRRRWYRYHHLFGEVLRAILMDERRDEVSRLHGRASEWYEQHGERSEAIRHAMAGEDFGRAADLIEVAIPEMRKAFRDTALRAWFKALPNELFNVRPVLAAGYIAILIASAELEGVEELLQSVERWLEMPGDARDEPDAASAGLVVIDEEQFRRLPSAIAMYRAVQARIVGDVAGTIAHAQRSLDLVGGDDDLGRGAAASLLALAYSTRGDLDGADRWWFEGLAGMEKAGYPSAVIGGSIAVADIQIAKGQLGDAMRTYERGLRLAVSPGGPPRPGAADMHVGMTDLFRERNDLTTASQHLRRSRELGDENGLPQNPYRWRVAAARIRQAEGDLDGAVELLDEAERLYVSDFAPEVRPVAAVKARVRIAQGKLSEAWGWAREHGIAAADELSYLHEFEHATLARLLLAQGTQDHADERIGEAIDLTERLVAAAEAGGRNGSAIDILVVQALARHARRDAPGALTSLARLLALAEPQGYVRVVLDEGPPMAALLKVAAKQGSARTYLRRLLAAAGTGESGVGAGQASVEQLSDRELEVLRLLATDLDGPGIARQLVVSLHTVRSHTNNIYAKLGVNSRRAAVRRSEDLDLLSRARSRQPRTNDLQDDSRE